APFRHKSTVTDYNRSANPTDITYEKLEFLGDAYLELLASRLLYSRFPHITAGQQSQLRELLVKNETLAQYAHTYNFDRRVQVGDLERMQHDAKERGNKGFNKVLGDVFEAYIAAVILSSPDEGFAIAEKWMQSLWAPKLLEAAEKERYYTPGLTLEYADGEGSETGPDPLDIYNPTAKADLQKKILGARVKLDYQPYRDSVELKGDQLGQNRHYIAVYLTGYGYERRLLGRGEGKNKVEAGNWAAQDAMFGQEKELVRKCGEELKVAREEKKRDREAKESAEKEGSAALRAGGGMNGRTGPPGIGGPPGMGNMNGINGAPSTRGMNSTRGIPGTGVPQPGPTSPNPSTGSSSPPVWRRQGLHLPIDEATGKIDRRFVGGTAGQNGIEKDGDLFHHRNDGDSRASV
ncbi:hypothetical protein KC324_g13364, partial [Hortaea werneckii]